MFTLMGVWSPCSCPCRRGVLKHEWMIAVLDDLVAYAQRNGLPALAEHLEQARLLAQTELANTEDESTG